MSYFIRDYNINIFSPEGDLIIITKPFSVKFSITRNTLASANNCTLEINGLGPSTRSKLFKDRFTIPEYWQIVIAAGYDKLETVFQGNILECYSYKQGTEWITKVEAYDGMHGIQNGFSAQTYSKDTDKKTIITNIIRDMPNNLKGILGTPSEGSSPRGQVIFGQSSDVLNEQTGGQYFIDNEQTHVLANDEVIGQEIIQLDSSILLSTPKRRDVFLDCDLLFFPEAKNGILVNLNSLAPEYIGQYKIVGFKHNVQISEGSAGNALTQLNVYSGATALRIVA
jgi:hypothetical protein